MRLKIRNEYEQATHHHHPARPRCNGWAGADYQKSRSLTRRLHGTHGYVYENIVAQMLTATGNKLFYHTWPSETSNHNYEVDFLLSRGDKLWPLEVKSSGYKTHKSLDEFCKKFSERINNRYLVFTKDYKKDGETTLLPVLMTIFL